MDDGDLTTLPDVLQWLSLNQADASTRIDEALLSSLITAASDFIKGYLGRPNLLLTTYQEVRDGQGAPSNRFIFANFPVSAVQLVLVNNLTIPAVPPIVPAPPAMVSPTFLTQAFGYLFTPTELLIRGYWVPRQPMCVTMQYTAGYSFVPTDPGGPPLPSNPPVPPLPADISQACVELVGLRYRERGRIGITSESVSGIGARTYSLVDLPPWAKTALERRKAVAPVSSYASVLAPP